MSDTLSRRAVLRRGWVVPLGVALVLCFVQPAASQRAPSGKDIFRFDTFGNETFWTDTLRLHEAIATAVDPTTALSVGLKVDADALPAGHPRRRPT